jgi:hypothetical protein
MDEMEEDEILEFDEESPTDNSSGKLVVSPFFDVPEGVDFEYEQFDVGEPEVEVFEPSTPEAPSGNEPSFSGEEVSPEADPFESELAIDSLENVIYAPTNLTVLSPQVISITNDGIARVDAIVSFDEADGAETYEVRVTKA